MRAAALSLLLLLTALNGGAGAFDVTPGTDRALWCGTALFWLATDAYDDDEATEGADFEAQSQALLAEGVAALEAGGFPVEDVPALLDAYDAEVLDSLGKDTARFDIITCVTLAEDLPPPPAP